MAQSIASKNLLALRAKEIERLKKETIDYTKITKSFTESLKPLIKQQRAQIKNQKTLITQNSDEIMGLTDLQERLVSVHQVTKNMEKTKLESISTSKAWTAASRILSGSGLWKLQNRIRAVIDVMSILEKRKI